MEQQRGQKRPMIENDCLATPAYQQDRMRQQQQREREQFMRSYRHQQQRIQLGPSCLNEVRNSHQNIDMRPSLSRPNYEPGKGALLVADYLNELRNRAKDNNECFWRIFVGKFFSPGAKNRLCISNTSAVPPKDHWRCEICKSALTDGFEVEFLPSLFRIKYDSGTLEELWSIDRPNECQNNSGKIILDYEKARLETIYENIHVVHEGQLRVILTPDLKISSWDFCVRQFEELVPKRLMNAQIIQLEEAARRYQLDVQNASSDLSAQVLQDSCSRFLSPVLELAKVLKPPIDRKFGFSKRPVQSLQICEVLTGKTMEKIMKYSKRTGESPTESLKVVRAVNNLLSVKHPSTRSREGQQHNRDRNPGQIRWTNPIPVNELKTSHTVELPHRSGSAVTPSTSNKSPRFNQQASGSRPLSSCGAASGSKEPLLETSFQAGPATRSGPQGLGSHIQLQQPSAGNVGVWEPQSSSDAVFNVAAATSAPADQNDLLILGDNNESGHFVDESNPDDEFDQLVLDWPV